jgi:hypothetical protein
VSAQEQIRNLLGRYCECVDTGDSAALADLLAEADLATLDGFVWGHGRDGVLSKWWPQLHQYDGVPRTQHVTANPIIDVDEVGAVATCRSSYVVFQATDGLTLTPIITGTYHDSFARDANGHWYFTERRYGVSLTGDLSHHMKGRVG